MTLKTTCKVTAIHKNSSSPAFKNLKVGDLIYFSIPVAPAGTGGRGTYASYIQCENLKTNEISKLSFNQISRVLDNFEWEEVN